MAPRVLRVTCLAVGALLVAATSAWAQAGSEPVADRVHAGAQNYPNTLADYVRVDLANKKGGVMTKALLLTTAERDAVWSVYEAYQREWTRFSNEREALLTEYVKRADSLDDATAKAVLAKCVAMEEERVALLAQYAEALEQKLPVTLVVKFIEAELRIQHLADIQLSDRLPDFR